MEIAQSDLSVKTNARPLVTGLSTRDCGRLTTRGSPRSEGVLRARIAGNKQVVTIPVTCRVLNFTCLRYASRAELYAGGGRLNVVVQLCTPKDIPRFGKIRTYEFERRNFNLPPLPSPFPHPTKLRRCTAI